MMGIEFLIVLDRVIFLLSIREDLAIDHFTFSP